MSEVTVLTCYVLFYILAVVISNNRRNVDIWNFVLVVACIVLTIIIGTRKPASWADTNGYLYSFAHSTNELESYSPADKPLGYKDKGYYFLCSIIRTLTHDSTVYLTTVAAIGMFLLAYNLKKYCYYTLIGLCIYIARFLLGRNFIQIRASVAIMMLMLSMAYIVQNRKIRASIVIGMSSLLHMSCLLGFPTLLLAKFRVQRRYIYWGVLAALLTATLMSPILKSFIQDTSENIGVAESYVSKHHNSAKNAAGLGVLNPMIYYQIAILWIYAHFEERIKRITSYYYLFRDCYFYSTLLLILFSSFRVLSGRTSTIYATLETTCVQVICSAV